VRATATLQGRSGAALTGTATFVQVGDEPVRVLVRIDRATPGLHGLHVHEKGDCSDPQAQAAGGHFNPARSPHAGPDAHSRHAGDLGNIEVREDGTGDLVTTSDVLTAEAGPWSVVGRAVVVHASEDDLRTQPTGNAGARVGCGVVTLAEG
jgi:Cu-Zn family superoxide dismutase